MERFNLRKLSDVEVNDQSQLKITNCFAAMENLDNDVGIDNTKALALDNLCYYEINQNKTWFDAECSKLLD
jgi:hypothetical protein